MYDQYDSILCVKYIKGVGNKKEQRDSILSVKYMKGVENNKEHDFGTLYETYDKCRK